MAADLTKDYPLGACMITYDATANGALEAVIIGTTLEGEDTKFEVSTEMFKVMVDQLGGAYAAQHIAGEDPATFNCSMILRAAQLPNLCSAYEKHETLESIAYNPVAKNVMYGTIKIHPLAAGSDAGYDFNGFKVSCNPQINGNFKAQDLVKCAFSFSFSGDDLVTSPTYGKIFTIGDYVAP